MALASALFLLVAGVVYARSQLMASAPVTWERVWSADFREPAWTGLDPAQ